MSKETTKKEVVKTETVAVTDTAPAAVKEVKTSKGNKPKEEKNEDVILKVSSELDTDSLVSVEMKFWFKPEENKNQGKVLVNGEPLKPILSNIPKEKLCDVFTEFNYDEENKVFKNLRLWNKPSEKDQEDKVETSKPSFSLYAYKLTSGSAHPFVEKPSVGYVAEGIMAGSSKNDGVQFIIIDEKSSFSIDEKVRSPFLNNDRQAIISKASIS